MNALITKAHPLIRTRTMFKDRCAILRASLLSAIERATAAVTLDGVPTLPGRLNPFVVSVFCNVVTCIQHRRPPRPCHSPSWYIGSSFVVAEHSCSSFELDGVIKHGDLQLRRKECCIAGALLVVLLYCRTKPHRSVLSPSIFAFGEDLHRILFHPYHTIP
ncbi:hypothetical protein K491DRAFT_153673 [Lophiostoma macrostomum CBS 122681]|uniref:Uncharacterized protein n=1 Tax=Lophiostoma macrostomum CBS 122681 TaxID=1314788 RepID=A0A6A6TK88_9PLEO|nr:hypothetical protein K491DRAFT_153673 [Lophiostoma macrostomum CBS 122681]